MSPLVSLAAPRQLSIKNEHPAATRRHNHTADNDVTQMLLSAIGLVFATITGNWKRFQEGMRNLHCIVSS